MRKFLFVPVAIVSCFFAFTLASCNDQKAVNDSGQPEENLFEYEEIVPMSDELKTQILALCYEKYVKDKYPERTIADINIFRDLGEKNGNRVFTLSGVSTGDGKEEQEIIKQLPDDYYLGYYHYTGAPLYVYTENNVHTITAAYDRELISEADAAYFIELYQGIDRRPRMLKRMNSETEKEIREEYAKKLNLMQQALGSEKQYKADGIIIAYHFGSYREREAIAIKVGIEWKDKYNREKQVDDVMIKEDYNCANYIYYQKTFYDIEDAYRSGIITRQELIDIGERSCSSQLQKYEETHGLTLVEPSPKGYAKKIYCNATISDDFDEESIIIILDKKIGRVNQPLDERLLSGIETKKIEDLTPRSPGANYNEDTFEQIFYIELTTPGKENVLDAIRILQKVDGICVEPNYYMHAD